MRLGARHTTITHGLRHDGQQILAGILGALREEFVDSPGKSVVGLVALRRAVGAARSAEGSRIEPLAKLGTLVLGKAHERENREHRQRKASSLGDVCLVASKHGVDQLTDALANHRVQAVHGLRRELFVEDLSKAGVVRRITVEE